MDRQWICIRGRKLLTTEFIHILDSYRCSFALRMRDDQVCKQYNAMICVLQELTSDYMEGKNHIGDQLSDFFKRCHMELPFAHFSICHFLIPIALASFSLHRLTHLLFPQYLPESYQVHRELPVVFFLMGFAVNHSVE